MTTRATRQNGSPAVSPQPPACPEGSVVVPATVLVAMRKAKRRKSGSILQDAGEAREIKSNTKARRKTHDE